MLSNVPGEKSRVTKRMVKLAKRRGSRGKEVECSPRASARHFYTQLQEKRDTQKAHTVATSGKWKGNLLHIGFPFDSTAFIEPLHRYCVHFSATLQTVNMASPAAQLKLIDRKIVLWVLAALVLTAYSVFVEYNIDTYGKSYKALCDISSSISCSTAFSSYYGLLLKSMPKQINLPSIKFVGKGFGLLPEAVAFKNPIIGLIFYPSILLLLELGQKPPFATILLILVVVSNLGSLFLGYILAFVLHVACVVCISIYVINFIMLRYAWRRWKLIEQIRQLNNAKRQY